MRTTMRTKVRHTSVGTLGLLSILLLGCGDDDDNGMGPQSDPLIDTWVSTSLVADGQDLSATGVVLTITFEDDGDYSFDVTNDAAGIFCDTGTSCGEAGTFTYTGSHFTLDPGTVDETTLAYTISGDTLTATGDIDGVASTLVFERQ